MTARLLNPIVVACAAFVLSVAAAAGWFWLRCGRPGRPSADEPPPARRRGPPKRSRSAAPKAGTSGLLEVQQPRSRTQGPETRPPEAGRCPQPAGSPALPPNGGNSKRIGSEVQGMRQEIDDRVIAIKADENHNLRTLAQTYSNLTAQGRRGDPAGNGRHHGGQDPFPDEVRQGRGHLRRDDGDPDRRTAPWPSGPPCFRTSSG